MISLVINLAILSTPQYQLEFATCNFVTPMTKQPLITPCNTTVSYARVEAKQLQIKHPYLHTMQYHNAVTF